MTTSSGIWAPTTAPRPGSVSSTGRLRCLARQGIAKTTVDDIARAAGLSRATAYRTFPRGKEGILAAVVETEVARLFSSLAVAMGEAGDLEDVLVAGMVESARWLRWHEPLTYLLEHEPGAVLPYLTFGGFDAVMRVASDLAAPFFARWLEPEQASRAAEWAVRIVMAYCSDPSPHADLTDPGRHPGARAHLRAARHPRPARRHGQHLHDQFHDSTIQFQPSIQIHQTIHQGGGTMTTLDDEPEQCGPTWTSSAARASTTSRPS